MINSLQLRSSAVFVGLLALSINAQPAFADSTRNRQWYLSVLDVTRAHNITQGAGIIVAVIDTGVEADHQDLTGNILPGVDFVAADTNGWVDRNGHGTAMAGLIAGHGHGPGGAAGIMGVAPAAKILPIRALKTNGRADLDVPEAIDAAVGRGAKVISMSFGTTDSDGLNLALQRAADADVVLIASSGNRPQDILLQYPAKSANVVAVGATGRDGNLAKVTVTGREMAITAPGQDIASTSNSGAYEISDGTSNAAAIVAGAAALVRARFPGLSATDVARRLTATAIDKGAPGRDSEYGFGELNLVAALTAHIPPAASASATAPSGPANAASASDEAIPGRGGSAVRVSWLPVAVGVAVVGMVVVGLSMARRRRRRDGSGGNKG